MEKCDDEAGRVEQSVSSPGATPGNMQLSGWMQKFSISTLLTQQPGASQYTHTPQCDTNNHLFCGSADVGAARGWLQETLAQEGRAGTVGVAAAFVVVPPAAVSVFGRGDARERCGDEQREHARALVALGRRHLAVVGDVFPLQHEVQPCAVVADLVGRHRGDAVRHVDTRPRRFRTGIAGADGRHRGDVDLRFGGFLAAVSAVALLLAASALHRLDAVVLYLGFVGGCRADRLSDAHPTATAGRADPGA